MNDTNNLKNAGPHDLRVIGQLCVDMKNTVDRYLYDGRFIRSTDGAIKTNLKAWSAVKVTPEHMDLACKQWLAARRREKKATE